MFNLRFNFPKVKIAANNLEQIRNHADSPVFFVQNLFDVTKEFYILTDIHRVVATAFEFENR